MRKFEDGDQSLGQITSLCVNSDGSRISLLSKQHAEKTSAHGMPHMRVYVYDCETDSFMSYNCGPKHYPVGHAWDATDPRLLACETKQMMEVCMYVCMYVCICSLYVCVCGACMGRDGFQAFGV